MDGKRKEAAFDSGRMLFDLIRSENIEDIQRLLNQGIRMHITKNDVEKCIRYVIFQKLDKILNLLVNFGFDIHPDDLQWPFSTPQFIKDIVYENVDVLQPDVTGKTALHIAVEVDDVKGVKKLLSRGANVHAKNILRDFETALFQVRSVECAKVLLDAGADIEEIAMKKLPGNKSYIRTVPLTAIVFASNLPLKSHFNLIAFFIKRGTDLLENVPSIMNIMKATKMNFQEFTGLKIVLQYVATLDESNRIPLEYAIFSEGNSHEIEWYYHKCYEEVIKLAHINVCHDLSFLEFLVRFADDSLSEETQEICYKALKDPDYPTISFFPVYHDWIQFACQDIYERMKSGFVHS